MRCRTWMLAIVGGAVAIIGQASAQDLIFLGNQGAMPGVRALAEEYSRTSGYKVTVIEDPIQLQKSLTAGPADLVSVSPEAMAELDRKGLVYTDTITPFTLAPLGVSVRAGAPKPDIGTVEAFRTALLNAKSIGYSRGCSGQNISDAIDKLGLTETLKGRIQLTGGGTGPVTFYLARGDFELGIQQSNIMVGAPGTDFLGPVPGALNKPCPNSVAVLKVSKQPYFARQMINFMVSPAAAPILRQVHEEPAKP